MCLEDRETIDSLGDQLADAELELDALYTENESLKAEVARLEGEINYWQQQAWSADAAVDAAYQNGFSDGRCEY